MPRPGITKQHSSPRLLISAAVQILLQNSSYKAVGILFPINPRIMPKLSSPFQKQWSLAVPSTPSPHPQPPFPLFHGPPSPLTVEALCLLDFVSAFSLDALPFLCSWQTFLKPFNMSLHCHAALTRRFRLSSAQPGESVLRSLLPSRAHTVVRV